ncbi:MAG: choice-of-anchor Q domain-containing protein [Chloroflexota bacterium]
MVISTFKRNSGLCVSVFIFVLCGLIFGPLIVEANSVEAVDTVVVQRNINSISSQNSDGYQLEPLELYSIADAAYSNPYPGPTICPGFPLSIGSETELNDAIVCYNQAPAGDYEINITADFLLSQSTTEINNPTTASLTINGNNHIIDGDEKGRVFNVQDSLLRVFNLTIQNGRDENTSPCSEFSADCGGGIYVGIDAGVRISESLVISNTATYGGGIFSEGSLLLENTSVSGNRAFEQGGGLYSNYSETRSTNFFNNEATEGGAIFSHGYLRLYRNDFISNTAENGGAIYSDIGSLDVTIANFIDNVASNNGGGIYNDQSMDDSSVIFGGYLSDMTFSGNIAGDNGGGFYNLNGSEIDIVHSTFSENVASGDGGAFYNFNGEFIVFNNSTFSGNFASENGGGIYNEANGFWIVPGAVFIYSSTITDNLADNQGSGIFNSGDLALRSSIIAGNQNGSDCFNSGSLIANSYNIDSDGNCDNAIQYTVQEINLGPLQNNGGDHETHALLANSTAIDVIPITVERNYPTGDISPSSRASDQRGTPRPRGLAYDVGAFEAEYACPLTFPANISTEVELNQVIGCFNSAESGDYVINFTSDLLLTASTLPIANFADASLAINGNGYTLDGNQEHHPFKIQNGDVTISDLAIHQGKHDKNNGGGGAIDIFGGTNVILERVTVTSSQAANGGAVRNSGNLILRDSLLLGNVAAPRFAGSFTHGGGLRNYGTALIENSVISDNEATYGGGGIDSSGTMTLTNTTVSGNSGDVGGGILNSGQLAINGSTISDNIAITEGGGIWHSGGPYFYDRVLVIANSTISNNSAATAGGLSIKASLIAANITVYGNSGGGLVAPEFLDGYESASVSIKNSIIANSISGSECIILSDVVTVDNSNFDSDGSCNEATQTSYIGLGPLQDNGGPTWTHALLPGSAAIDAAVADPEITTDQRGVARPQGNAPDVGAIEAKSLVYVSTTNSGTVDGVTFTDEDILEYDQNSGNWRRYFDGSDVGLAGDPYKDVDAFTILSDGSILLSIAGAANLPDVGEVDDSDIIRFIPTKIGPKTEGNFELYFDGSDVNLDTDKEDIDALSVLTDGRIVISTLGAAQVLKKFGNVLNALDEDLIVFTPTSLGENTAGYFDLYVDGSDFGLNTPQEDMWGVVTLLDDSDLLINTQGSFDTGTITGNPTDIVFCSGATLGSSALCSGQSIIFDGSANGLAGEILDGIHFKQ